MKAFKASRFRLDLSGVLAIRAWRTAYLSNRHILGSFRQKDFRQIALLLHLHVQRCLVLQTDKTRVWIRIGTRALCCPTLPNAACPSPLRGSRLTPTANDASTFAKTVMLMIALLEGKLTCIKQLLHPQLEKPRSTSTVFTCRWWRWDLPSRCHRAHPRPRVGPQPWPSNYRCSPEDMESHFTCRTSVKSDTSRPSTSIGRIFRNQTLSLYDCQRIPFISIFNQNA